MWDEFGAELEPLLGGARVGRWVQVELPSCGSVDTTFCFAPFEGPHARDAVPALLRATQLDRVLQHVARLPQHLARRALRRAVIADLQYGDDVVMARSSGRSGGGSGCVSGSGGGGDSNEDGRSVRRELPMGARLAATTDAAEAAVRTLATGAQDPRDVDARVSNMDWRRLSRLCPFTVHVPSGRIRVRNEVHTHAERWCHYHRVIMQCEVCAEHPAERVAADGSVLRVSPRCDFYRAAVWLFFGFSVPGLSPVELPSDDNRNHPSMRDPALRDRVHAVMEKYVRNGTITEVHVKPHVITSLLVVLRATDQYYERARGIKAKPRVCFNRSKGSSIEGGLNGYLKLLYGKWSCRLPTMRQIVMLLEPDAFIASRYFLRCYLNFPLSVEGQQCTGFRYTGADGVTRCFVANSIVFGDTFAVAAVSMFTALFVDFMRHRLRTVYGVSDGTVEIMYIDDLLIVARTKKLADLAWRAADDVAEFLNFRFSEDKDQRPTQRNLEYLGFLLSTAVDGGGPCFTITAEKRSYIVGRIEEALAEERGLTHAQMRSLAHMLFWYADALLPGSGPRTDALFRETKRFGRLRGQQRRTFKRRPFQFRLKYSDDTVGHLDWLRDKFQVQVPQALYTSGLHLPVVASTDASGLKEGGMALVLFLPPGYFHGDGGVASVHRRWRKNVSPMIVDEWEALVPSGGERLSTALAEMKSLDWGLSEPLSLLFPIRDPDTRAVAAFAPSALLHVCDASAAVLALLKQRSPQPHESALLLSIADSAAARGVVTLHAHQPRSHPLGRATDILTRPSYARDGPGWDL